MQHGELPGAVTLHRTTDAFDSETVPTGLLRAHQIADGVWGRVCVLAGTLRFVWEDGDRPAVELGVGDALVIPPRTPHHVEPGPGVRFLVEFHR